jgi:SAM-dependent methyltransferase
MTAELRDAATKDAAIPRFGGHADLYARWRPAYPDWIFDRLTAACGAPTDHAIELGAGTGQATGALLTQFARVTAVEPDADMAALIRPHPRLDVRVQKAEEAEFAPASADAVFAATSFHWMDQTAVSRNAASWLRPGGAFLAVSYGPVRVVAPGGAEAAYRRVEAQWRSLKHRIVRDWRSFDGAVRDTGAFASVEKIRERWRFEWSAAQAAGFYVTTSFGSEFAKDRGGADAFRAELERAFGGPDAVLTLEADFSGVLARV